MNGLKRTEKRMAHTEFDQFFQKENRLFLLTAIRVAVSEDGADLTSQALFSDEESAQAQIVAKEPAIAAGLPIIPLVFELARCRAEVFLNVDEGEHVGDGAVLAVLQGPAAHLLRCERVILNFMCHMSGIAGLTRRYAKALHGTRTRLLDTRKTLPGLRCVEKYAVRLGGGHNHRMNLSEMLMLKDNHIDRSGGIRQAVERLRAAYSPCPPIEVECRDLDEVREAAACMVNRIMLDNMDMETMAQALALVPPGIETEVSGNVTLENIRGIGLLGPDFVSVGRLTHSAPAADLSMRITHLG